MNPEPSWTFAHSYSIGALCRRTVSWYNIGTVRPKGEAMSGLALVVALIGVPAFAADVSSSARGLGAYLTSARW